QGLNALAGRFLRELQRAEQIVGVGNPQRRLLVGLGEVEQRAELQCPFEQGVLGVNVMMNETGAAHPQVLSRRSIRDHAASVQSTAETTSRLAISIQASTPPVNPMRTTMAIASFTKPSIATAVVSILFLYVRCLFPSSNKRVTVNQALTARSPGSLDGHAAVG